MARSAGLFELLCPGVEKCHLTCNLSSISETSLGENSLPESLVIAEGTPCAGSQSSRKTLNTSAA